jgi:predicted enzyme related to lactoylglutathione lyase
MANSVAHFEIFASDVERARKFYEGVFGWTFEVAGPPDFYLISTGLASDPGLTHGLIAKRRGPAQSSSNASVFRHRAMHPTQARTDYPSIR